MQLGSEHKHYNNQPEARPSRNTTANILSPNTESPWSIQVSPAFIRAKEVNRAVGVVPVPEQFFSRFLCLQMSKKLDEQLQNHDSRLLPRTILFLPAKNVSHLDWMTDCPYKAINDQDHKMWAVGLTSSASKAKGKAFSFL
jgi:hypothetical protein